MKNISENFHSSILETLDKKKLFDIIYIKIHFLNLNFNL